MFLRLPKVMYMSLNCRRNTWTYLGFTRVVMPNVPSIFNKTSDVSTCTLFMKDSCSRFSFRNFVSLYRKLNKNSPGLRFTIILKVKDNPNFQVENSTLSKFSVLRW